MKCVVCDTEITTVFYSMLNGIGDVDVYCEPCYSKVFLDNHSMTNCNDSKEVACECGKEKHGFASHSNWCGKA